MAAKRTAKKKRGEAEAQMGIQKEGITNKQKAFIKSLLRDRDYPQSAYLDAVGVLVQNQKTVESKLFPGTDKEHFVTRKEASQLIGELVSYPFRKRSNP